MTDNTSQLTIHMVSSLDGMIAKPDNSTTWFDTTDHYENGTTITDEEITEFLKTVDCYVMGANTYEHALKLSQSHGWPYGEIPTIVVTHRDLATARSNIEFFAGDLTRLVKDKLKPKYKNIWVVGGPILASNLIRLNLVDEIRLSIIPILLGQGTPFFVNLQREHPLHLQDVKAYKNGMIEMCYALKR